MNTDKREMKKKKKTKIIKAWGLVDSLGYLSTQFNSAHSVFQPRLYSTEIGARKVSDIIVTGADNLKVVSVEIHIKI